MNEMERQEYIEEFAREGLRVTVISFSDIMYKRLNRAIKDKSVVNKDATANGLLEDSLRYHKVLQSAKSAGLPLRAESIYLGRMREATEMLCHALGTVEIAGQNVPVINALPITKEGYEGIMQKYRDYLADQTEVAA